MPQVEFDYNSAHYPYRNAFEPRVQIFFGGSSSGKSVFLAQRAVRDVLCGDYNYLVVRKVAKTIRTSVFNEIVKIITEQELHKLFKINKTDLVITCVNGSQILFVGLDDVEKLKSIIPQKGVIGTIWIEEATEIYENDIKQLQKRLRGVSKNPKRLVMSFNPILKSSWIYKEYFKKWADDATEYHDKDLLILKTTYKDNKFLTLDDIQNLENESDKYYYDVYTLGNWGVLGNLIFKNWEMRDLSDVKERFDNIKNGLDFGFSSDPAAYIRTHYDKKRKTIYIFDEIYERELTNDALAVRVKEIIGNEPIVCDSAEPKSIREFRLWGVNARGARKGKDSVNHGIDWLKRQTIIIHISCQNAKNEMQAYKWKEDKDGNVLKVPIDKMNHLIDALRYAYEDESRATNDPVTIVS